MERLRDEPLHEKTPHRAMECSDQPGCRLKDEPTTPPYQRRPGTASGVRAVLWPQTTASPSVRQEQSHGRGGAPASAAAQTIPCSWASAWTVFSSTCAAPSPCPF